jgi:oxalate decarboxylase/phosphoglucose isomerase-like protein (cupin superfamily)
MNLQTGTITLAHQDDRRAVSEFNGQDMSIQVFEVFASDLPLGRHFHRRKRETFLIQEGSGEVLLCEADTDGNSVGQPKTVKLESGSVVVVDPMMAHTFYLAPGTKMVCFSSAPFNPDDMDLNATNWLVR